MQRQAEPPRPHGKWRVWADVNGDPDLWDSIMTSAQAGLSVRENAYFHSIKPRLMRAWIQWGRDGSEGAFTEAEKRRNRRYVRFANAYLFAVSSRKAALVRALWGDANYPSLLRITEPDTQRLLDDPAEAQGVDFITRLAAEIRNIPKEISSDNGNGQPDDAP